MKKSITALFFTMAITSCIIAQTKVGNIELNKIIRSACPEVPLNSIFTFEIKNHEFDLDEIEDLGVRKFNPKWIKSIEVIRKSKSLIRLGYDENDTLVNLKFKRRHWRRLPKELRSYLKIKKNK